MKEYKPKTHSKLPFKVMRKSVWHSVKDADGKTVCNCRNIMDAELIVRLCNAQHALKSLVTLGEE